MVVQVYRYSEIFPTRVGMDRSVKQVRPPIPSIPHTRGDGPFFVLSGMLHPPYSPHAWGWTAVRDKDWAGPTVFPTGVGMDRGRLREYESGDVFPTRVGMDRRPARCLIQTTSIPHTRGDGPDATLVCTPPSSYSPHAWGWTAKKNGIMQYIGVFPTRVGMDRPDQTVDWRRHRIPHTRGDGP